MQNAVMWHCCYDNKAHKTNHNTCKEEASQGNFRYVITANH